MRKTTAAACGATVLVLGLSGCGASFEGSGSKDAASAEQLAMHADDPWDAVVQIDPVKKCGTPLRDGVYTGTGKAMAGNVTVTLLVDDNRITCLETAQDGETQSVGGFEALRDGTFQPGQAVAFAGPRGCGKSFLQHVVTAVLGGRVA